MEILNISVKQNCVLQKNFTEFSINMGNSLVFPVPKCNYTASSLQPFYHQIPVTEEHYSSRIGALRSIKRSIPSLLIKSSNKSKYLIIYFHGNSDDLGRMFPRLLEYYEQFQVNLQ